MSRSDRKEEEIILDQSDQVTSPYAAKRQRVDVEDSPRTTTPSVPGRIPRKKPAVPPIGVSSGPPTGVSPTVITTPTPYISTNLERSPVIITGKELTDSSVARTQTNAWFRHIRRMQMMGQYTNPDGWERVWTGVVFDEQARDILDTWFNHRHYDNAPGSAGAGVHYRLERVWTSWDVTVLSMAITNRLNQYAPHTQIGVESTHATFQQRLLALTLDRWSGTTLDPINKLVNDISVLRRELRDQVDQLEREGTLHDLIQRFIRLVIMGMVTQDPSPLAQRIQRSTTLVQSTMGQKLLAAQNVSSLESFVHELIRHAEKVVIGASNAEHLGFTVSNEGDFPANKKEAAIAVSAKIGGTYAKPKSGNNSQSGNISQSGKPPSQSGSNSSIRAGSYEACWLCGRTTHKSRDCPHANHAGRNKETKPWGESSEGKKWAAIGHRKLDAHMTYDDASAAFNSGKRSSAGDAQRNSTSGRGGGSGSGGSGSNNYHGKGGRGELVAAAATQKTLSSNSIFLTCTLLSSNRRWQRPQVSVLLDSGAQDANYINSSLAIEAHNSGFVHVTTDCKCNTRICSIIGTIPHCVCSKGNVTFIVQLHANKFVVSLKSDFSQNPSLASLDNDFVEISVLFTICSLSHCDIVIGMPSIRRYDLTRLQRYHFVETPNTSVSFQRIKRGPVRDIEVSRSDQPDLRVEMLDDMMEENPQPLSSDAVLPPLHGYQVRETYVNAIYHRNE